MGRIITLRERKMRKAAARRAAAQQVMAVLRAYAREHGGRFIVFGSAARDRMRFHSDLDVLVDFPLEQEHDAIMFVEDACAAEDLPCDILPFAARSQEFLDMIKDDMVELA